MNWLFLVSVCRHHYHSSQDGTVFFKGQISTHWGDIQLEHYDEERSAPTHNLKKYHYHTWWTVNVIKQTVYIMANSQRSPP